MWIIIAFVLLSVSRKAEQKPLTVFPSAGRQPVIKRLVLIIMVVVEGNRGEREVLNS